MQLMYPWFLLGLLGIAVPVVIHLLELRRPQRVLFTNTAFIKEVELVTVQRRKLQHLLILLARVLTIVALVMVFCQPFIQANKSGVDARLGRTSVLVDNTFSMQARSNVQNSLFENAIDEARNLAKSAPTDAKVELANYSGFSSSLADYQNRLEELRLSSKGSLRKLIRRSEENAKNNSSLYVISDFQKNDLNLNDVTALSSSGEVILFPLAPKAVGNVYVDSLWLDDAFVRMKANVGLHIRLRNGGGAEATACPVKVFLDDKQVGAFQVTIGPGKASTAVVQIQLSSAALAKGRVITEDRPVTFDNTHYFTLQPAGAINILEIGAEPVTKQLYGNEPLFSYAFTTAQRVDYGLMRRANLVLLREVNEISEGLREGLRALVKRGGTVVVVPPALVNGKDSYEALFRDLGIGNVQRVEAAKSPELREVAMPNAAEPFFREVFGAQSRAVIMPRVAPVLRWSRTGNDILRMRDGESYLANFRSGAGQVYVFSAPFAKEYSDFAAHALFVPVMYRMAMLSYRDEQLPAYRLNQETVTLKLPAATEGASNAGVQTDEAGFRFVNDSLTLIPVQRVLGQEVRLEVPTDMDQAGFYQVQRQGKVLTTLAFNQDKRESELATYAAQELREMIGPNHPNVRVVDGGSVGSRIAQLQAEQTGQPLWRHFLAVALACLLAEALLVRFGTKGKVVQKAAAVA